MTRGLYAGPMELPDYPLMSAKLLNESRSLCDRCGLALFQKPDDNRQCTQHCPARIMRHSAEAILNDYHPLEPKPLT